MEEERRAIGLIREFCADFPSRRACSYQERAAQQRLGQQLSNRGVQPRFESFRWNMSLYSVMALHFGLAVVGVALAPSMPLLGALVFLLVGVSYWADSSRNGYVLRRLLPRRESQNLLATLPAAGAPELRVVLPAHVDASFTGRLFSPRILRMAGGGRSGETQPYHARSMELATDAVFVLFALAIGRLIFGFGGGWYRLLELVAALPALIAFAANMEIVFRDRTVPGAADNLSGVAANMLLIDRFLAEPLANTELVFAFTGAEEAGTGGAYHMARIHQDDWSRDDTIVVGVDTVCNGQLRWLEEGEMDAFPIDPDLERNLVRVAALDERFADVRRFRAPVGASDATPFLARGYKAVTISCVDTEYGAPRHYHHMNDRPENVEPNEIVLAVDFIEALVRILAMERAARSENSSL